MSKETINRSVKEYSYKFEIDSELRHKISADVVHDRIKSALFNKVIEDNVFSFFHGVEEDKDFLSGSLYVVDGRHLTNVLVKNHEPNHIIIDGIEFSYDDVLTALQKEFPERFF